MHTGGEPLRIVTGGYPKLPKGTILEKRAYVRDRLDHLRKILMFEPRGHFDMYGAVLVEPNLPGADLAVLFMHNEGYSTMCGHAIIALGRYAVDYGIVPKVEPVTTVHIECPCGMVVASVEIREGKSGGVSFESVPAFLFAERPDDRAAGVRQNQFRCGLWRGLLCTWRTAISLDSNSAAIRRRNSSKPQLSLTEAVKEAVPLDHPDHKDLAFLYGSILTDGADDWNEGPTKNVCIFADAQLDRSPTGSGVTARLAAMYAKGQIREGNARIFESIVGSRFAGFVASKTKAGDFDAITARVSGHAYYSGKAEFIVEDDDPLGQGFLVL